MAKKYWYTLLKNWKDEGKRGYTIPFIIGSQQYLPTSHINQDIKEMFLDIVTDINHSVYITYCTDLNDIIIGAFDDSKLKIAGYYPLFAQHPQTAIYVTKIVEDRNIDLEELIENFIERFDPYIKKGQYSIINDERGDYSDSEMKRIKDCYSDFT